MNMSICRSLFVAALGIVLFTSPAGAVEKKVNCDKGQSIQAALETATGTAEGLVIRVSGTCNEFVTISRDRVSIVGENGATIVGQVSIRGPSNVGLRDLMITGPGDGLIARNGRTRVRDCNIVQNDGVGVRADHGAFVGITGGQVTDNYGGNGVQVEGSSAVISDANISGHSEVGVSATETSRLNIEGGAVTGNGIGIEVNNNSSLELAGTDVSGNEMFGLLLFNSSGGTLAAPTISGNGWQGLELGFNSSAFVTDGTITGNGKNGVYLAYHSMVGVFGTEIFDNTDAGVAVINDSGAVFGGETYIPDNGSGQAVFCLGRESSVEIGDHASIGFVDCPRPQW